MHRHRRAYLTLPKSLTEKRPHNTARHNNSGKRTQLSGDASTVAPVHAQLLHRYIISCGGSYTMYM